MKRNEYAKVCWVSAMVVLLCARVFAADKGAAGACPAVAFDIVRGNWTRAADGIVLKEGSNKQQFSKYNCDYRDPVWSQAFLAGVRGNDLKLSFRLKVDEFQKIAFAYLPDCWARRNYPYLYEFSAVVFLGYEDEENGWQILFSPRFNEIAIFNPATGIVRAVPADLPPGKELPVEISANAMRILLRLDGKTLIDFIPEYGQIKAGKVGFGGYYASLGFSDIHLEVPGKLEMQQATAHRSEFRQRDWLGDSWIFDRDEPIARIVPGRAEDDGFDKYRRVAFTQVKLRPGGPPVVPVNVTWDMKNMGGITDPLSLEAKKLANNDFRVLLQCTGSDKRVTVKTQADFHYDSQNNSYQIDFAQWPMVKDSTQAVGGVTSGSFWAYNCVGPTASGAAEGWRRDYGATFSQETDGKTLYRPLNHDWMMVAGCKMPSAVEVPVGSPGPSRRFGYLGENGSPVKEILGFGGKDSGTGYCQWLYDYTGPYLNLPAPSDEAALRYRVRLLTAAEEKVLREHNPLDSFKETMDVAMFEPSGTSFGGECWTKLTSSYDRNGFLPPQQYAHDSTTGRRDHHSLLLKPDGNAEIGAEGGACFFGEVWAETDKFVAEAWVRTEELSGKGVRLVVKDTRSKKTYESDFVKSAPDWQRLSVLLPGNIKLFRIQIEKDGKGKAWVDDISIRKTE